MSVSGQPFTYSVLVPSPPGMAMQAFLALPPSGNYFDGYEVRQIAGNSFHVTRRYVPVWAIVLAVIGVFFFLLGLLFLLVRETEVLTVTVYEQKEGSSLDFSGVAAPGVVTAVNITVDRLLNGLGGAMPAPAFLPHPAQGWSQPGAPVGYQQPAAPPPAPPGAAAGYPPDAPPPAADSKVCPECAETIRAAARSCRFCGYRFDAG